MTTYWSRKQKAERAKLKQMEIIQKRRLTEHLQTRQQAREGDERTIKERQETGEGSTEQHTDRIPNLGNARLALPLLLLLFGLLVPLANASNCGTKPSSISSLITSCLSIQIINGQATATPTNFQQNLTQVPFNALVGNVVIYNSISGSLMPAWVENSTIIWVNLGANIISADSSANGIYVFGFGSGSTNFFITGNNIGEAPQLSGTYGQYDNGATVFPLYYQRWGGLAALPSGWGSVGVSKTFGTTSTTLTASSEGTFGGINAIAPYSTTPFILDTAMNFYFHNPGGVDGFYAGLFTSTGFGGSNFAYTLQSAYIGTGSNGGTCYSGSSCSGNEFSIPNTISVYGITLPATTTLKASINYSSVFSSSVSTESIANLQYGTGTKTYPLILYWTRIRAYPPNGVMPTVNYGSITAISINPSPVVYGQTSTITATCIPSGDSCAVESPLGTELATGTGSATYTTSAKNTIGTQIFYANDLSYSSTTSGNLITLIPLTISNIIGSTKSTMQISQITPFTWNTYYPALFNITSPSSTLSYTLTSSPALINLPSNTANLYYLPPSNALSGNYIFTATEFQIGNSNTATITIAANTLSMNDISANLGFSYPCNVIVQYFPSCSQVPSFTATPTSWYVQSDNLLNGYGNANQIYQGNNIDVWANANQIFLPSINLCYNQFNPQICFAANAINNPAVTTITQTAWKLYNQTAIPSAPYTRQIAQINGYNESSGNTLAISTTYSANLTFNNYTIPISVMTPTVMTSNVYAPLASYQNPKMLFYSQSLFSSNSPYYISKVNNPFQSTINAINWQTFSVFLPPAAVSSLYSMTAYKCSGYVTNDYLQVLGGSSGNQKQTQQYYVTSSSPFSIPLLNGNPYQFIWYTPSGVSFYSSAISVWTSPITLYLPCSTSNYTPPTYVNITTACTPTFSGPNMIVTCTGEDKNNLVSSWTVDWINQTTLITSYTMNTQTQVGSFFSLSYAYPSNSVQYREQVIAHVGTLYDPDIIYTFITGSLKSLAQSYNFALFAIALILIPICLAYFHRSALLLLEVFVVIIGQMIGVFTFTAPQFGAFITIVVIVFIIEYTRV